MRLRTTIHREGWYYILILAMVFGGAMFKEVNLLLILAGMLLGPVLLNWQAVGVNLRGLRLRRRLPNAASAGDTLSVSFMLTNTRHRLGCWGVLVEEEIRHETPATQPQLNNCQPLQAEVWFPYVAAGQTRHGGYRCRLTQRGRWKFGPPRLATRFPFGLFSRCIIVGESRSLLVLPRLGRLTEGWTAHRIEAFAGAERRGRPGPEGDFYGVRQWQAGDGRRLVHWRSSARLGKLVVRQHERPRSRDLALLLELWEPASPSGEQLEAVERAVSFAATVLCDLCRKGGCSAWLVTGDPAPQHLGGAATPAMAQTFMERLATIEAQTADLLPTLFVLAAEQLPSEVELVLVSTRPINFAEAESRAALRAHHGLRDRLRHVRCIDASSEELSHYFHIPSHTEYLNA